MSRSRSPSVFGLRIFTCRILLDFRRVEGRWNQRPCSTVVHKKVDIPIVQNCRYPHSKLECSKPWAGSCSWVAVELHKRCWWAAIGRRWLGLVDSDTGAWWSQAGNRVEDNNSDHPEEDILEKSNCYWDDRKTWLDEGMKNWRILNQNRERWTCDVSSRRICR